MAYCHDNVCLKLMQDITCILSENAVFMPTSKATKPGPATIPQNNTVASACPDLVIAHQKEILLNELKLPYNSPEKFININ